MTLYELQCQRFLWINIVRATPADSEVLRSRFPFIHPTHLEDLVSPSERPKLDERDEYLFAIMQFPVPDARNRLTRSGEADFIIMKDVLITAHDGTLKKLTQIFAHAELDKRDRDLRFGSASNDAFYALVDTLVDSISPILNHVDETIHRIEQRIFEVDARSMVQDISFARRDVIALRRIVRQQVPVIEGLAASEHPLLRSDQEAYFDDILDHILTARDIAEEDYEIIVALAETADTLVSHRINEVMRGLTVMSVIMLPLSLIAGIFGMNVVFPLDGEQPLSFIVIMLSMVIISVIMILIFRQRKWL
jgi:magnesium transporter